MNKNGLSGRREWVLRRNAPLVAPTDRDASVAKPIAGALNAILAEVFGIYMKTKNCHWYMSGPQFREHHLLLDEQADQLYAMTDPIAKWIRKTGGSTLTSSRHISRIHRLMDRNTDYGEALDMLAELCEDNQVLAARLRDVHELFDEHCDIATASLIETWIEQTEQRVWFLFQSNPRND
jgi:starvation-inducible DNA-binding protein